MCSERQLEGEEDNVQKEPAGRPGRQAQDPGRRHQAWLTLVTTRV